MVNLDKPIELEERKVVRKGLNNLRTSGNIPAVIHNHGAESVLVMGPEAELTKIYNEAGMHHPLQLHVGDQKFLALIKDVNINPVKRRLQHVVFQAIRQDEKVEAEVPIHFEGEAPAEKVGLVVLRQLDTVEVEALPKDLPDELKVDATKLAELHDKITVADLQVPAGVTINEELDHPIATVVETRAQVAEEAAEGELEGEEAKAEAEKGEGGEGETGNAPKGAEREAAGQEAPKG